MAENDHDRVWSYLMPLLRGYDTLKLVSFVHAGVPVSKARARYSPKMKRFYTPSDTQTAEQALAWQFRTTVKDAPWKGNIAIAAVFFRPNHQRIDADNLMKLVLDAGTKAGVWNDDSQVTHQVSVIEKDAERPRTVIALSPVISSLDRNETVSAVCLRCGTTFERDRAGHKKYCSKQCHSRPKGQARCPKCDVVFDRRTSLQRYCSDACRIAETLVRQSAERQRPPALCQTCGRRVSRREYLFCALCRRQGRKPGSKNKPKAAA